MFNYLYGGERAADSPAENADPAAALRQACDAKGTFARNADGTLTWEDFLIFRGIVGRQANRKFAQVKA